MKYFVIVLTTAMCLFTACHNEVNTPKPKGYYRIELPPHAYKSFDTTYAYKFEYASIAFIVPYENPNSERYWINIVYPSLNATIHISYKKVNHNIDTMITDSKSFVFGQIKKAEDIIEYHIYDTINKVYGIAYDILGKNVACPYQFWLTDYESNFFRGALYFNQTPNNDSLSPAITYIKEDILHLLETFSWKN